MPHDAARPGRSFTTGEVGAADTSASVGLGHEGAGALWLSSRLDSENPAPMALRS